MVAAGADVDAKTGAGAGGAKIVGGGLVGAGAAFSAVAIGSACGLTDISGTRIKTGGVQCPGVPAV
jgi:hypothetical protein